MQIKLVASLSNRRIVSLGPGRLSEESHDALSASWAHRQDAPNARLIRLREPGLHGRKAGSKPDREALYLSASSSLALQGALRDATSLRTSATAAASTGSAVLPQLRRT